jgi:hypothetical protein
VQPINNPHVVCEDQLSSTGGESSLSRNLRNQHVSPNLHFRDNFSVDNLNSVISGGNQSRSSHNNNICSNFNTNVSNGNNFSLVTDDPSIVRRSSRVRKPPDRFGEWVRPITANIDHFQNHAILFPQSFTDQG